MARRRGRVQADRALAGCERLVEIAGSLERDREIVVGIGEIVAGRDRAAQVPERIVGAPELEGRQPAAVEALGMVGMDVEHPAIERIGVGEPAAAQIGLGEAHASAGGSGRRRGGERRAALSGLPRRAGAADADALPGP